jgi:thiol-disulfide isomerase/thioredoxin
VATDANDRPLSVPPSVLLLVALMIGGFAILPRLFKPREAELVGKPAPDFTLKAVLNEPSATAGKGAVTLSELRGQAVLLDFWATWCGPCQAEAPIINKVAQRYRDRGLVVVGVNTNDAEQKGRAWAAQRGLTFPIVHDKDDVAAHAYGVENLPTLVVVSRAGNVIAVRTGVTDDAELEALVKQAL